MPKIPTQWTINKNIGTVDAYDTSASYNGGGTSSAFDSYDGVAAGQSTITNKIPTVWGATGKTATQWLINSGAQAGLRAYDGPTTPYDSNSLQYDGNTKSQITVKIPTVWSAT